MEEEERKAQAKIEEETKQVAMELSPTFLPTTFLEAGNQTIEEQKNWTITDAVYVNMFDDKVQGKLILTETCLEFKVD
jgi:hypothetical protein